MTQADKEKFARLCEDDLVISQNDGDCIGTYNEKRLHRILKRYVTEDAERYEVRVGACVADIMENGRVTEIQTASFRPLQGKIENYLAAEYSVTVLHPLVESKTILRADKETGEILYTKKSPKKGRDTDILPQMYYLKDFVGNPRFEVRILHVRADEYRFSERMRYRREGAYDNDLRPVELLSETVFRSPMDYVCILPEELRRGEFTSADFSKATKHKGRRLSLAISFLLYVGVLERRKDGKRYIYKVV